MRDEFALPPFGGKNPRRKTTSLRMAVQNPGKAHSLHSSHSNPIFLPSRSGRGSGRRLDLTAGQNRVNWPFTRVAPRASHVPASFRAGTKARTLLPTTPKAVGLAVKMENQFRSKLKEYYPVALDLCAPTALATTLVLERHMKRLAVIRQSDEKFQPLPSCVVILKVGLS